MSLVLDDSYDWFVETPLELVLDQGIVMHVSERSEVID